MSGQRESDGGDSRRAKREARLALKLRQNLVRRKSKVRATRDASGTSEAEIQTQSASTEGTNERET
jgi:hypothetical protein